MSGHDNTADHGNTPAIVCENLVKIYKTKDVEVVALQGLDLTIERAEMSAIIGNSGSGKSTLMNILGGLDRPSAGTVTVDGKDLLKYTDRDLIEYRRSVVGFVWQNVARNLVGYLSALGNVMLPMVFAGARDRRKRAEELLTIVGLSKRMHNKPSELSGGEQQRVAIALALANKPTILLADEPTGSVDTRVAGTILQAFRDVNRELGVTVVIVTHDPRVSRAVDRVVAMRDGRTSTELIRRGPAIEDLSQIPDLANGYDHDATHDEFVVLDKAGRLQIPARILEQLGVHGRDRLIVETDADGIRLRPQPKEAPSETPEPGGR